MGAGRLKRWASSLKRNVYGLYFASRDPRVPVFTKIIIGIVLAYALSPIDLIPDIIPVIGYLDDLVLLPLGFWLAIRLIPREVWQECQLLASQQVKDLPSNYAAAMVIFFIWCVAIIGFFFWLRSMLKGE
ncbi:MAG: DUF1232 domain-containing protein [Pseudomonadales bacterium]|nr:DUF1232 domain-containing protein [Pseudomonadales bacterium]